MFLFMRCHITRSQHLQSLRDAGTDECIDEYSRIEKFSPKHERVHVVADDDGNDGGLIFNNLESHLDESIAHVLCVREQSVLQFRLFLK